MKKIDRKITINGVEILIRANNEQEYAEILAMKATAKACLLEPIPQKHDYAEYTRNWFEVFSKPNIERATRQARFSGKIKKSSMKKSRTGLSVRPSLSKKPSSDKGSRVYSMEKCEEERAKALPKSELFKIHGCELELDPVRNCFKPPVWRITHGVFFFGIGKDPFNGSTSQRVGGFSEF